MSDSHEPLAGSPLSRETHRRMMERALEIAEGCRDIEWYGVGCVLAGHDGTELATGFTGELTEGASQRHAEDVAIAKALQSGHDLHADGIVLYSTLEPCSVRASGKTPCCRRIIDAGIRKVVYGAKEPFDPALNIVCEGQSVLEGAGIAVLHLIELEERCLASAVSKRKRRNG